VLNRFGFKEIYFQDLPLGTQFALVANAEIVFAPHGAGLANTIFMREGGKVLEAKHKRKFRQDRVFPALSRALGLSHYVIESERDRERDDDLFINPAKLEFKLEEITGGGNH
jgi:capsular polysaccharide biosynthesis protein